MMDLRSICPICRKSENLRRCQGCMVMLYCCQEHQIVDRDNHEEACDDVKRARISFEMAERLLRAEPPSFLLPENVFETGVGHFWTILDTRNYMRTRYLLVDRLTKINTYEAVKSAFDHIMDMLRLGRTDIFRFRYMVPALFIRLGNDQECYDFMKWHATTGTNGDYDWGNTYLPYIDVKDANVFEPVNVFTRKDAQLEFAVALMLIKVKLLTDVQALHNSFFMYDKLPLPAELVDRIRKEAIVGKVVLKRKDLFVSKSQQALIEELNKQLKQLFQFVQKGNKYIWPGLIDPKDYLEALPTHYKEGSEEHAQVTVQYYYQAYVEAPDAIQMIKELIEQDGS